MKFNQLYENWIKPTDKINLHDMLHDKGWQWLGEGAYGEVFGHPKKNFVLKIYKDKGYRTFLDFLESQQGNPNVVMIKRHIFKSNDFLDKYSEHAEVVALEKLKPLPYGSFWERFISKIWGAMPDLATTDRPVVVETIRRHFREQIDYFKVRAKTEKYYNSDLKEYIKLSNAFEIILKRYRNLINTIFLLKAYVVKNNLPVRFDLHSGNFMIRPSTGQIVITDPLTNAYF